MRHFHTIKSILNNYQFLLIGTGILHFHTIKSILNHVYTVVYIDGQRDFHTIKSILNRDEKSLKSAKKS